MEAKEGTIMQDTDIERREVPISGMTCVMCSRAVERSIGALPGVRGATVDLARERAAVEFDPSTTSMDDIIGAVRKAGYEVPRDEITVNVGGMTCAVCARNVERTLLRVGGISEARVNLATESVKVAYSGRNPPLSDIRRAVEGAGFGYLGPVGSKDAGRGGSGKKGELRAKLLRFTVGFSVSVPMMLLMYAMRLDLLEVEFSYPVEYLFLAVTAPTFIFVSYPIFKAAFRSLRNRALNMDVMYSMGIGVAFGASILGTFGILLDRSFSFYDTALMLASFLTLGRYLEARAKGKTSRAIERLMEMAPSTATVMKAGVEKEIPLERVVVGDVVLVRPGDSIPVDGIVIAGESLVNESMITGEPVPVPKDKGKSVFGGTINENGVLRIRTAKVGKDTVLARIIRLVTEAQGSRPPVQRVADRVVTYFIPVILAVAILAFLGWYVVAGESLLFSLTVLISILVVACPCALGLATPTAVTVGIGRGAELGILIKNGEVLEVAPKLDVVVFDKTGTLTRGRPSVVEVITFGQKENELLGLAASLEWNSNHPLASALVEHAEMGGISLHDAEGFEQTVGKGVSGMVKDRNIMVGNRRMLEDEGIDFTRAAADLERMEKARRTAMLVAVDKRLAGVIGIADPPRKGAGLAVSQLKRMGLRVVMMTGDNERAARALARSVGITDVAADVLPESKESEVGKLQERGEVVAFVGDGINDAPALARADVGIAMGSGTDVAMESGDVVLVGSDVTDVAAAVQLGRKVMGRIKQNLFWALAYNSALVPLAAGVLRLFSDITFPPELAGGAMAMSSVTVVSLSLMLRRYVPPVLQGGKNG